MCLKKKKKSHAASYAYLKSIQTCIQVTQK